MHFIFYELYIRFCSLFTGSCGLQQNLPGVHSPSGDSRWLQPTLVSDPRAHFSNNLPSVCILSGVLVSRFKMTYSEHVRFLSSQHNTLVVSPAHFCGVGRESKTSDGKVKTMASSLCSVYSTRWLQLLYLMLQIHILATQPFCKFNKHSLTHRVFWMYFVSVSHHHSGLELQTMSWNKDHLCTLLKMTMKSVMHSSVKYSPRSPMQWIPEPPGCSASGAAFTNTAHPVRIRTSHTLSEVWSHVCVVWSFCIS